uniref:Uncharacterized protein n=1 Tax=Ananas comosus var. bracteatus TaxID=296719 RepID=A0A6V7NER9_ANACO|nr:unnamed protein product [Ananas comosus var. bracteatus]
MNYSPSLNAVNRLPLLYAVNGSPPVIRIPYAPPEPFSFLSYSSRRAPLCLPRSPLSPSLLSVSLTPTEHDESDAAVATAVASADLCCHCRALSPQHCIHIVPLGAWWRSRFELGSTLMLCRGAVRARGCRGCAIGGRASACFPFSRLLAVVGLAFREPSSAAAAVPDTDRGKGVAS